MFTKMPDRIDLRKKPSLRLAGPPRERNAFMFVEALSRKAIPFIPLQRSEQGVSRAAPRRSARARTFCPETAPPPPLKVQQAVFSSPGPGVGGVRVLSASCVKSIRVVIHCNCKTLRADWGLPRVDGMKTFSNKCRKITVA